LQFCILVGKEFHLEKVCQCEGSKFIASTYMSATDLR